VVAGDAKGTGAIKGDRLISARLPESAAGRETLVAAAHMLIAPVAMTSTVR
jgi:hypothetical protein